MTTQQFLSPNVMFWVFQTVAMLVTGLLIPGLRVRGPLGAFLMVVALAFVNSKVWDAALFFKLPDSFTTQAIVLLLSNGVIFWVLVKILPWIEVDGILPALVAPVVFSIASVLIGTYAKDIDWEKVYHSVVEYAGEAKTFLDETAKKSAQSPQKK